MKNWGKIRLFIFGDKKEQILVARDSFLGETIQPVPEDDLSEAKQQLNDEHFDIMIIDSDMPKTGLELLKWIKHHKPELPAIIISSSQERLDVMEVMSPGNWSCFPKPIDWEKLSDVIKKQTINKDIFDSQRHIDGFLKETGETKQREEILQGWIGETKAIENVRNLILNFSKYTMTTLITGESGTGKEIVARMIHNVSPQASAPFISVAFGGVPENLLENELFGYEKDAFTGAIARKIGVFELASSGSVFLDEIEELPMYLQEKLLRIIQQRKLPSLGNNQNIEVKGRIIVAMDEKKVKNGLLREDIYESLINIPNISLPPLRERGEDIPLLIEHFIKKFNRKLEKSIQQIESKAVNALQNYNFPGNVRELKSIIERAMTLSKTDIIMLKDLWIPPAGAKGLDAYGIQKILETLGRLEGNQSRAAKELGIDRATLRSKLKKYGLED